MRYLYFLFRFALIWVFTLATARAQTTATLDPTFTKIIPPSPNAASLGLYGVIPVSKYTGVPSIEVPLHTLSVGSLSLPISLSYHASGIKVAQEASWVGLGWSLNAGGVISRSIRGNDDFNPYNGYLRNTPFPCNGGTCPVSASNWQAWAEIQTGREDSAPDEFYYNVGGYAGKLVYVRSTGKFMPLKADNLRIIYNGQWVITTPNGVRYVFGTTEKTAGYSLSSGAELPVSQRDNILNYNATPPAITSWYLDSVVAPTKEYIVLKYRRPPYQIPSIVYESQSFHWLYQMNTPLCPPRATGTGTQYGTIYEYEEVVTTQVPGYGYSQSAVEETCLQEIQDSEGTKLTFVTDDRQDLNSMPGATTPPQKLTKIIVSNLNTARTVEHELSYSYFPSNPPAGASTATLYKYLRLRLDQVTTRAGNLVKPPYRFTYNNGVLPAKTSKSIDHWGFYNGATRNDSGHSDWDPYAMAGSLIPSYSVYIPDPNGGGQTQHVVGADRDPDANTVQYGLLTSMTYPTGGKTTFSYGINRYHDHFHTETVSRDLVRVQNRSPRTIVPQRVYKTFTVNTASTVTVRAYSYPIPSAASDYRAPSIQETCPSNTPSTKIYRDPNNGDIPSTVYCCVTLNDLAYSQGSYLGWVKYNDANTPIPCGAAGPYVITKTIYLPAAGTYQLNLTPVTGFLAEAWISIEETRTTAVDVPVGGVRIQRIVSDAGQQTLTKTYDYTYQRTSDEPIISSGVLLAPLAYHYMATIASKYPLGPVNQQEVLVALNFMTGDNNLGRDKMLMANSTSCLPLSTSGGGSSVGYSQVTETLGTAASPGGRVVETFMNNPERSSSNGIDAFFPGVPNVPRNENGLLLRTAEYAADGTLLRTIGNTYTRSSTQPEIAPGVVVYSGLPRGGCTRPSYARYYEYRSEWWRKIADTTTVYAGSAANRTALRTATSYDYDPTNLLTKQQQTTTSTGAILTTRTSYAHNAPTETLTPLATWNALTVRHMIGIPIKQETYLGNRRIQASITNYSTQLLPVSRQLLEDTQLPVRLIYDSYDEQGNLTQYHPVAGTPTAVVWGYQHSSPVLMARNASYTALTTAVRQALLSLGYTSLTDLDAFLGTLGELTTSGQQQQLRTFTQLVRQHSTMRNALITIYTHHPLFGKLSETEPAGRTTFFEYDAFGRLKCTRDEQRRILSQQQYHYAGN